MKFTSKSNSVPLRRTHSGFTLIELLTVIAIIAILASILIPVVGSVRASARAVQCKSNLRQIGVGMFLYAGDNKNRFPVQTDIQVADPLLATTTEASWMRSIAPFISLQSQDQLSQVFFCPNVIQSQTSTLPFSYAMNFYLCGQSINIPSHPSTIVLVRHTQQSRSSFAVQTDNQMAPGGLNYSDGKGNFNYLFADGHVAIFKPLLPSSQWKVP